MESISSKATKFPLIALLAFFLITGCLGGRKNGRLPASTGQPYEVVLEGDTDNILAQILTEDVPGLPQSEPLCKIINVKRGKVRGSYQLVRTRISVDVDNRNKGFSVKLGRNENAAPQTVIRIKAQNIGQLRKKINGQQLRNIIDSLELQHLASIIKQNPEKQQEVKRIFGLDMKIPLSLDASKKGKDFLWLSNNAGSGMQNIIFMKVKREEQRENGEERKRMNKKNWKTSIKEQVDSILQKNILGETDDMYMRIPLLKERGLWEMHGDAMGGPYIMKKQKDIVIIGFVYAPETKKRNLTKQIEAVLTTIH